MILKDLHDRYPKIRSRNSFKSKTDVDPILGQIENPCTFSGFSPLKREIWTKLKADVLGNGVFSFSFFPSCLAQLFRSLWITPLKVLQDPIPSLKIFGWYAPVPIIFGLFILWNGGIVLGMFPSLPYHPVRVEYTESYERQTHDLEFGKLGHQQHHIATIHTPQLFYFLAFSTIFGWPVLLNEGIGKAVKGTLKMGLGTVGRMVVSLGVLGGMIIAVRYQT